MRKKGTLLLAAAVVTAVLAGCSKNDREPNLLQFKSTGVPDEFSIVPFKPLEFPEGPTGLPEPAPGSANRADLTPSEDAVAALGGTKLADRDGKVPTSDHPLLINAARRGVEPNIRKELAEEDLNFRRKKDAKLLERWFNVNVYADAYRRFALDGYAEIERLRRLKIRTVEPPPKPE